MRVPSTVTAFSETVEPDATPFTASAFELFAATCPTSISVPPLVTYTFTSCESVLLTIVGSPQEIIDKVMYERGLFGHDRFLAQLDIGGLPYAKVARSIELLATKVMPALR